MTDTPMIRSHVYPIRRGWMAVSTPDSALRFAVIAETEAEAQSRFEASKERWIELWEMSKEAHGSNGLRPVKQSSD